MKENEKELKQKQNTIEKNDNKKKVWVNKNFGDKTYKKEKKETDKEKEKREKYIPSFNKKEKQRRESLIKRIVERQRREKEDIKNDSDYDEELDAIKIDKKYNEIVEFNYISKKEFKKLKKDKNTEIEIIGHFNPKEKFNDDQDDVLKIKNFAFDVREKKKGRTAGYVVVKDSRNILDETLEEKEFEFNKEKPYEPISEEEDELIRQPIKIIRYYKKSLVPFFLLILVIGLLIGSLWYNRDKIADITGIDLDDVIDWDGENTKNESKQITEQTVIPGFTNLTLSKSKPHMSLGNPKENTVYFVYKITNLETNELVHETKGIAPGKAISWNPYNHLKKGKYKLGISIEAFDVKTMRPCNGANQKMELTLE